MFFRSTPSEERTREMLAMVADRPFTHGHEGATRTPLDQAPAGYLLDAYGVEIGRGLGVFERARQALERFAHYPLSFTRVVRLEPTFAEGTVFGTLATHLGFASMHPCRIAFVIDEESPPRFGFGLGTLPGHFGEGEESFVVSFDPEDGSVRYDVQAISRAHGVLGFLGHPLFRLFQRRFRRETCAVMRAHCTAGVEAVE